ncbi:FAD-dependent oxidoreductase [Hydrogenivirga sp. 128-5-R1-1]|uniref:NAD(P)/FAD-dependent oxidoreductase n=1 Tax=Hydrogenivirga sp. 128-5-R1-1 TaxID=392423 RepID=UPI00015F11EA|nr:FAD-dependent oxidoreductase [Hydrogenivirga sp. 128-5-R1-1]EDP73318.1 FAD-dependent pyridine nucleotide-disulphide oxidoreductase [Hydrogenivirga sp. 128-5-R1-1]
MGKIKVVVCGLGYGGISFLRNISNESNVEIVAIDQNPFHYLQPEVYRYIAHEKLLSDILIDLFALTYGMSKNIQFVKSKILNINLKEKKIITEDFEMDYDFAVISLGSRTFFPPINGLREYSSGVKTIDKSMKFKHFFEKIVLRKMKEEDICMIDSKSIFNIVVGGGGLSGVEIAAEMAYFQEKIFSKVGCGLKRPDIYLIEALPSILYGMDDFLVETAVNRLKDLGVNIITGKKIVSVYKDKVELEDGTTINSDFLIWTGGIVGSSVINNIEGIKKNRKNQIITDKFFRVEGYEDTFAIGDCAEVKNFETGETLPATAQVAVQTGKIVAEHIKSIVSNKPLKEKYPNFKGILAALGGKYAAGVIKNKIKIKGFPAHLLKEAVFKTYKFPLKWEIRKTRNILSQNFHT